MKKNDLLRLANVLEKLSKLIKADQKFLDRIEDFIENFSKETSTNNIANPLIDIFEFYSKNGKEELTNELNSYQNDLLIKIIQKNNLDTSKLSHKWKNKEKLVKLIIERIENRMEKGDSFLAYGQ